MDEEAELLVELAIDDVEVAVLLAESLHFSSCLAKASEVQQISVSLRGAVNVYSVVGFRPN